MTHSPTHRSGYTLLEVLLASAIAALLMAALYVGIDVQLRTVQAGREKVNETAVVRNLFVTRITSDMAGVITPITATVAVTSTSGDVTTDPVTPFNGGVQGDNAVLTVWTSRLPNLPTGSDAANADSQQLNSSDLRRITYWLVDGQGLARQETDRVSASGDDSDAALPPNVPDEGKYILAPEVTEVNFRYFDGESWQDTWDGTVLGTDGKTPMGPPRAIEVTMSVRRPGADPNDDSAIKQYLQVIPINAANAQSTTISTGATGTTGTTGTTGGTSP
jgi:prepilin-type N-terminal cleavage/methylation domain-containing protein